MKELLLASVLVVAGCATMWKATTPSLAGTWSGILSDGSDIDLIMTDDMRMKGTIAGSTNIEFTCKYAVDYSSDPITFDQYDFEDLDNHNKFLAIIKMVSQDEILMCGNMNSQGGRPSTFTGNAYTLENG